MKNLLRGHSHVQVKDFLSQEDQQPKVALVKIGKRVRSKREENKVVWSSEVEDAKATVDAFLRDR